MYFSCRTIVNLPDTTAGGSVLYEPLFTSGIAFQLEVFSGNQSSVRDVILIRGVYFRFSNWLRNERTRFYGKIKSRALQTFSGVVGVEAYLT